MDDSTLRSLLNDDSQAPRFVRHYDSEPTFAASPEAQARRAALSARSSVCSFCGVGCPYTVVPGANGKDKLIPLSPLGLCIKGATSLLSGGDERRKGRLKGFGLEDDRIRAPQIRGHDGLLHEVSWEQALDRAAWLFLHTREWVGPSATAVYGNGQKTLESIWLACLYKLVFNLPTIGANSEHCLASAGAAHELNFGNEASFTWQEFEELELAEVIILHGTNPYVTFPQAYEKLKRNKDAVKVVIDPVVSDTAEDLLKVDPKTLHIRFAQGGDVLFNLAVARVIFEEGWEDRAFMEKAVSEESIDIFTKLVMEDRCEPGAVARTIALEEQDPAELEGQIRTYAALIARPHDNGHRPLPAFVSSMGINQSTGSYGFSTNLNLLLMTGNVGRRGAGSLRIAGQSNATSELMMGLNSRRLAFNLDPHDPEQRRLLADALDLPLENIPDREGTAVSSMADDDYLYCFIFIGTQMTRNMPRLGHWTRRMGRAFNIIIDSFMGEGVRDHADVVLPSLTYTEREGVIQRGDRTLQLQQPVTAPPPKAWSDEKILVHLALAIAKRLQDPDTAILNNLDPEVVHRSFARYLDDGGDTPTAGIFDHIVELSHTLNLYNRLADEDGVPISHQMLRERAGIGVQWQGDARYAKAKDEGSVFPGIQRPEAQVKAKLVRPPERFLARMVETKGGSLKSLISGRGRPGKRGKYYRGRYNSGIKTLPITGPERDIYYIEVHPDYAKRMELVEGDAVRISSHHGMVVAHISLNPRVPVDFPFVDFVPGEVNRLTNYLDSDQFTNQSLIKRTPIRIRALGDAEATLWAGPDHRAFTQTIRDLDALFSASYASFDDWNALMRGEAGATDWLPLDRLFDPQNDADESLGVTLGAAAIFLQRYMNDKAYRAGAKAWLGKLKREDEDALLRVLLPTLRKLDYHSAHLDILDDVVGPIPVVEPDGSRPSVTLKGSHQAAVLELKEEVVAVQLYVAIKRGLELLYGEGNDIPRADLAFVSGIAIPCAGDVPAYVMGVPPGELASGRLIHCRSIGTYALMAVDRRNNKAVRFDIHTGVLPRDKELIALRSRVIMQKQAATRAEHRRFFDRLGELIAKFVRDGDKNYHLFGPVDLPWEEFQAKLSFAPTGKKAFRQHLRLSGLSHTLIEGLIGMGLLHARRDAEFIQELKLGGERCPDGPSGASLSALVADSSLSAREKLEEVIIAYVAPVLENDGGKIDLIDYDDDSGEATVRFVGSCANCPYSMLSLETIVKPALMNIPGVTKVTHRGRLRPGELAKIEAARAKREAQEGGQSGPIVARAAPAVVTRSFSE